MNCRQDKDYGQLVTVQQEITTTVRALVKKCEGDSGQILSWLRTLELLHREIREEMFLPSLPDTRNSLYYLLKEIQETGGWPYIERMKLQEMLINLSDQELINQIPEESNQTE